ncbi:MAG: OsmC family protein [Holophaga sp.]|jgi:organic hydroperoxide reductase OsmC/OhrA
MTEAVPANLKWQGNTASPDYTRSAELTKPGGSAGIPVSALPKFNGAAERWNPEDLLAGTLAHCHMLTFLALAAKAQVAVLAYEDRPEAVVVTEDRVSRVGEILLQPTIKVAPGTDRAKVVELFQKAHKYCVIANSLTAKVAMEPGVVVG